MTTTPATFSPKTIEDAIRLHQEADSNYLEIQDNWAPELLAFANRTTPGTLDTADFVNALALLQKGGLCAQDQGGACQSAIRKMFHLPLSDPDGVTIRFQIRSIGDGKNVAMVIITPKDANPADPPDVFVSGLANPVEDGQFFLPGAVPFAQAEKRRLILVDAFGVGGSLVPKGKKVDYEFFADKVNKAILEEAGGAVRYYMGFSYGSAPVRHAAYEFATTKKRTALQYVLIAGLPALDEERAGRQLNPAFTYGTLLPLVLHGKVRVADPSIFFSDHTGGEQKDVMQKQVMLTNMPCFVSAFLEMENHPLLEHLGPDIAMVLFENDRVVPIADRKKWRGRGLYFLPGGHESVAGGDSAVTWERLRQFLHNRPDLTLPRVDPDTLASRMQTVFGVKQETTINLTNGEVSGFGGLFGRIGYSDANTAAIFFGAHVLVGGNRASGLQIPITGLIEIDYFLGRRTRFAIPLTVSAGYDPVRNALVPPSAETGILYDLPPGGIVRAKATAGVRIHGSKVIPTANISFEIPIPSL